ncbi:MAG: SRPBCC family protein [Cytophagales bacterium]|nr:SRPBCC family protein [Cytophagales bacterium]
MPKMHIEKSTVINAPVEKIYNTLNNFNHWTPWSPWLIQEPEAKVEVAGDAKYYSWEGNRIGTGNMKVTAEKSNESIDYDLNFVKPWKSSAKVRFEMKSQGEGTEVTWLMDGSLPVFMFWMKKMMEAYVGMDYERGLSMLKEYVEDGTVHSKLDFNGSSTYPGCTYVGVKTACTKETIGTQMEKDFGEIWAFMSGHKDLISGHPFSIYHKWDLVKNKISYTSGVPVSRIPDNLPDGFITGKIPKTPIYTVKHTGPYGHLGNAWSTLYSMERNKSFKANKKIDPFETYANDPGEVPHNELITEVHFATK